MDTPAFEFLYYLFAGIAPQPPAPHDKIIVDGKNDSLFLNLIHARCFGTNGTIDSFLENAAHLCRENAQVSAWIKKRQQELENNFQFGIWTAWKTIIEQKNKNR